MALWLHLKAPALTGISQMYVLLCERVYIWARLICCYFHWGEINIQINQMHSATQLCDDVLVAINLTMINHVGYQVQLFDAVGWVIDKQNEIWVF